MPRARPGTVLSKAPHHRGRFHVEGAKVRAAANRNPSTVCWRCGLTLAAHAPHKNGKRPHWQAGHVHTGDPRSPLKPEPSTCNTKHGAAWGNRRRKGSPSRTRVRRTATLNTSRAW